MTNSPFMMLFAAAVLAALTSYRITGAIRPLLLYSRLQVPTRDLPIAIPTPQGAGIAVIAAALIVAAAVVGFAGAADMKIPCFMSFWRNLVHCDRRLRR